MGEIWLVRHAPTTLNGVCYGQSDVPVTLEPAEAARAIAEGWDEHRADVVPEIWTSPWARTRRVALELARHFRCSCHVDARLSELSFGEWEGRTFAEIENDDSARFERWMRAYEVEGPPGGETAAQLRGRVSEWLGERRMATTSTLAVTHAGVIRTAWAIAAGLEFADFASKAVCHLCPERIA